MTDLRPIDDEMIARLLDRMEIVQVLAAYCRGVDRLDIELVKSAYWGDATDDHGFLRGPAHEYADGMKERLPRLYEVTSHLLGQTSFLDLAASHAVTETYFTARHRAAGAVDRGHCCTGRYLDRFEKRAGAWKIARRVVVMDFYSATDAAVGFHPDHIRGRQGSDDPSFAFTGSEGRG